MIYFRTHKSHPTYRQKNVVKGSTHLYIWQTYYTIKYSFSREKIEKSFPLTTIKIVYICARLLDDKWCLLNKNIYLCFVFTSQSFCIYLLWYEVAVLPSFVFFCHLSYS